MLPLCIILIKTLGVFFVNSDPQILCSCTKRLSEKDDLTCLDNSPESILLLAVFIVKHFKMKKTNAKVRMNLKRFEGTRNKKEGLNLEIVLVVVFLFTEIPAIGSVCI